MTTPVLITHLQRRGVTMTASGYRLRLEGPPDVLTPDLRSQLADRKPEILAVIRGDYGRAASELLLRAYVTGKISLDDFWMWGDWYAERAAILEADGSTRQESEAYAYGYLADHFRQATHR